MQTDTQTHRQTHRHTDRHLDRHTDRHTGTKTHRQTHTQTGTDISTYTELIVIVRQRVVEAVIPGDAGFRHTGRPAEQLHCVVFKLQAGGSPHVHASRLPLGSC